MREIEIIFEMEIGKCVEKKMLDIYSGILNSKRSNDRCTMVTKFKDCEVRRKWEGEVNENNKKF